MPDRDRQPVGEPTGASPWAGSAPALPQLSGAQFDRMTAYGVAQPVELGLRFHAFAIAVLLALALAGLTRALDQPAPAPAPAPGGVQRDRAGVGGKGIGAAQALSAAPAHSRLRKHQTRPSVSALDAIF